LLSKSDSQTRFILEQSPFSEDGEDEEVLSLNGNRDDPIIIGRIFPNSEIYNQGSYRIEIKVSRPYPMYPPATIRLLTRIYHPNVAKDGKKELLFINC
jgi:ubiquitin-protein ligase